MRPMERKHADDDGRTVADMREVDRPGLWLPRVREEKSPAPAPSQDLRLEKSERRAIFGGALSAGLLVAGVLALSFALLILLIQWVWG